MKKTCIICRKEKEAEDFNLEHIIPESLGNKLLTTNDVCIKCNSLLGSKVDSYLVNFDLFGLARNLLEIRGKTGKLPPILPKGKLDDGRNITIFYDNNNKKNILKSHPLVNTTDIDGITKYSITANSKEEFINVLNNIYKKKKHRKLNKTEIKKYEDIYSENVETIQNPEVKGAISIESLPICLSALKSAYELIWEYELISKNKFTHNSTLNIISKTLCEYIYNDKIDDDYETGVFFIKNKNFVVSLSNIFNEEKILLNILVSHSEQIFNHSYPHIIWIVSSKEHNLLHIYIKLLNSITFNIILFDVEVNNIGQIILLDPLSTNYKIFV